MTWIYIKGVTNVTIDFFRRLYCSVTKSKLWLNETYHCWQKKKFQLTLQLWLCNVTLWFSKYIGPPISTNFGKNYTHTIWIYLCMKIILQLITTYLYIHACEMMKKLLFCLFTWVWVGNPTEEESSEAAFIGRISVTSLACWVDLPR